MLEVLDTIAVLAAALGGYFVSSKIDRNEASQSEYTCPYDGMTFTGVQSLDAINHVGCYARSEEDLKKMAAVVPEPSKDDYYSEWQDFTWIYKHYAPVDARPHTKMNRAYDHYARKVKVWRNGDLIAEEWATPGKEREVIDRIITIDKHKRKSRRRS